MDEPLTVAHKLSESNSEERMGFKSRKMGRLHDAINSRPSLHQHPKNHSTSFALQGWPLFREALLEIARQPGNSYLYLEVGIPCARRSL